MRNQFFLSLASTFTMTSVLFADTIDVPAGGDIQSAIVTASDGDVIQLAAGTYQPVSTINLFGKAVTLRGATDSSSGELLSILDGQDTIRLLVCRSDEGPGTVFENLIVENGRGQPEFFVGAVNPNVNAGGGLYIESANPTVTGCVFRHNVSVTTDLYAGVGAGVQVKTGSLTMRNCTFLENIAFGAVGAFNSDSLDIQGCTFLSNAAENDDGSSAIQIVGIESVVVSECTFSGNLDGTLSAVDTTLEMSHCLFSGNSSANGGGAIFFKDSIATLSECTFSANSGGGSQGGALFVLDSTLEMSHCLFEGNRSSAAAAILFSKTIATLSECTFFDNVAEFSGGAIQFGNVTQDETSPSDVTLRDCVFARNVAYEGGALYVVPPTDQSTSPLLERCTFDRNVATQSGGAIYNFDEGSPVITDCTFTSNTAADSGGAICSFASSNPTIENCDFTSNHASSGGAVASLYQSMTSISGSRFLGNTADRDGGAVYSFYSDTTTTGCDFTANRASESGGGMHNDFYSGAVITDCTFTDNSTDADGGALVFNLLNFASATIDGCTFTANTAFSGGGAWSSYSNPVFTNCTFTANIADKGGAFCGVFFNDGSFTDCTLKDNIATPGLGGAMYLTDFSGTTVTGSLICGNTLEQIEQTSPGLYVDGGGNLVTTECEPVCVADLNGDGMVDGHDLTQLLASWGPCPDFGPCSADFTADGEVNGADLTILLSEWGPCPG
jgi:parallel beta-helix repeat protein/predicted outer membrane repeat protein